MSWRLANSLVTLRNQVNAMYPNRSKVSDGTIGDAAHQTTQSDHNPNSAGVVTAWDVTHDSVNGVDIAKFSRVLADSRDPRIKYLIANDEIWWTGDWYDYPGSNPHDKHMHISVSATPSLYDDGKQWQLKEEPMFNEGDRVNLNNALYGSDKGLHKDQIGKPFKDAIYAIMSSETFNQEARVNKGDTVNYFRGLVGKDPTDADYKFHVGRTHKFSIYDLIGRPDVQARLSGGVTRDTALDYITKHLQ